MVILSQEGFPITLMKLYDFKGNYCAETGFAELIMLE
jgi:hypothetical protein